MTPAINAVKAAGVPHRVHPYAHDPATASYGEEAVQALGLNPARVFKTLVAQLEPLELVVAVIPVPEQLNLKALAHAAGAKRAALAELADAERATGYVAGGISPLGQRKRLRTFLDRSALNHPDVYISAGRRGLEISLAPEDLARLLNAPFADLT